jgi:hypothetical protein
VGPASVPVIERAGRDAGPHQTAVDLDAKSATVFMKRSNERRPEPATGFDIR